MKKKEVERRCPLDTSSDLEDDMSKGKFFNKLAQKKKNTAEMKIEIEIYKNRLEEELNTIQKNNSAEEEILMNKINKCSNPEELKQLEEEIKILKENHAVLESEIKE